MLLAVDVGNTNTVLGLYDPAGAIAAEWRVRTLRDATADELEVQLAALLALRGLELATVDDSVVSSTVPALGGEWEIALDRAAGIAPVVVGAGIRTGMPLRVDFPREVGPDRIANAVAAFDRYRGACIVADFGTSTNFDVVSAAGEFVGGVIAPGVEVSLEALTSRAARLGKVDLIAPPQAIGTSTVACMQSGAIFGTAGQIDGLVRRIRAELGVEAPVVATGGLAELISPHTETVGDVDPRLTLAGLRLLWARNREGVSPAPGPARSRP